MDGVEIHDVGSGRWLVDRERSRFAEVSRHHDGGTERGALDWRSFVEAHSDEATGDLVIHVTPTSLVRLVH